MRRPVVLPVAVGVLLVSSVSEAGAIDVVILGGEKAAFPEVALELASCVDGSVSRVAGANRFENAAAISRAFGPPALHTWATTSVIATGLNFPNALAGGAFAARIGFRPILLVGDSIPSSVRAELEWSSGTGSYVLGGSAAVPETVVDSLADHGWIKRLAGSNRYDTAAVIAQRWTFGASVVYVAVGEDYPDALAGVPAAAQGGHPHPILLVRRDEVPRSTAGELDRLNPGTIKILGG